MVAHAAHEALRRQRARAPARALRTPSHPRSRRPLRWRRLEARTRGRSAAVRPPSHPSNARLSPSTAPATTGSSSGASTTCTSHQSKTHSFSSPARSAPCDSEEGPPAATRRRWVTSADSSPVLDQVARALPSAIALRGRREPGDGSYPTLPQSRKLSTLAEALHQARDDCFQPNPAGKLRPGRQPD